MDAGAASPMVPGRPGPRQLPHCPAAPPLAGVALPCSPDVQSPEQDDCDRRLSAPRDGQDRHGQVDRLAPCRAKASLNEAQYTNSASSLRSARRTPSCRSAVAWSVADFTSRARVGGRLRHAALEAGRVQELPGGPARCPNAGRPRVSPACRFRGRSPATHSMTDCCRATADPQRAW